jgi:hypothetical protein
MIDQETYGAMTPKKALEKISQFDPTILEAPSADEAEELAEKEA